MKELKRFLVTSCNQGSVFWNRKKLRSYGVNKVSYDLPQVLGVSSGTGRSSGDQELRSKGYKEVSCDLLQILGVSSSKGKSY